MIQNGIYVNLGDLLNSFTENSKSTFKQVNKGEDEGKVQQKSYWLIVLCAWESHVQGEAVSNEATG